MIGMKRKFSFWDVLIWAVLLVVFLVMFYPFFYTLFMAVMPHDEFVRRQVHVVPAGFTLDYVMQVLNNPRLARAFLNSILRTGIGTVMSVIVTIMVGYALSRKSLPGRKAFNMLFIIPMWIIPGMIPYYLTIRAVGLLGSFWAMIIPMLISSFNMFIARAYFYGFPQELLEASKIDGAGEFKTFLRIVWPTSTPLIATMALLIGSLHWNDFFWPGILVPHDWQPAPVVLHRIVSNRVELFGLGQGAQIQPQSFISAVAAILIVPVLVVYPFLQKYVVKGIMLGSVKG